MKNNFLSTQETLQFYGTGEKQTSKPTKLAKGEYVYFCPMNPTAIDNTLIVE